MAEEVLKKNCDGHCDTCGMSQRSYCAAQIAYYNQQEIAEIKAMLADKSKEAVNPIGKNGEPLKTQENGIIEDIA